jgi:hypothetical protein
MRYSVEFEMQSDLRESVSEAVHKSLVAAFGSIEKLKIVPQRVYVGYLQENQQIFWREVPNR